MPLVELHEAKELLSKCLFVPVEKIGDDASISSIKVMDSLTFEALALEVEEHLGREIPPIKLLELKTVRDLAELIGNRP
jgi:acyl carrier protein